MRLTLRDLADRLEATLHLPPGTSEDVFVNSVAPIDTATSRDVSFLINPDYFKFAAKTQAAVVIVGSFLEECKRPQLVHKNPYWAFATTAQLFQVARSESKKIDPKAFISPQAKIGRDVTVYSNVYVSEDATVGDGVVLFPGVYLGRGVRVGRDCILRANVVIEDSCVIGERVLIHANTTVGADGFGFASSDSGHVKIPQTGIVCIEDDVEIGAGCTIDRAAMGKTIIGRGTKLDSSVHVGHGAKIGAHGILCSGVAIGGSAKIGDWVVLAGASSVSNNVELTDHVTIGALAGVTKNLPDSGEYMGFPAVPANQWRREVAGLRRLKILEDKIRNILKLLDK